MKLHWVLLCLLSSSLLLAQEEAAPPVVEAPAPETPPPPGPVLEPAPEPTVESVAPPAVPAPAPVDAPPPAVPQVEPEAATAALPLLTLVGLLPCFCSVTGLVAPAIQWFTVKDRPAFPHARRGMLVAYGALAALVAGTTVLSWVVGALLMIPVFYLASQSGSISTGMPVFFVGFGFLYLAALAANAAFWLMGEPLLFWWAAQ